MGDFATDPSVERDYRNQAKAIAIRETPSGVRAAHTRMVSPEP